MSRICDRVIHIAAVTAVVAVVGAVPASAIEVSPSPVEVTTGAVAVAANDALAARSFAAAPLPGRRAKTVRTLPPPASRPVTVSYRYQDCSGFWCGRQFVLMVGIGY